jgi:N-acetylglutamate synthase-like GNAT family acetyltransferase
MRSAIRRARPSEAELLSELALRSKAHWGYDEDFLRSSRRDLSLTPDYLNDHTVFVAEEDERVIGFYSLRQEGPILWMDQLFVETDRIGTGWGGRLFKHSVASASELGASSFQIEADPNAEAFYRAMGAHPIGHAESPVKPGRMLPVLVFDIEREP